MLRLIGIIIRLTHLGMIPSSSIPYLLIKKLINDENSDNNHLKQAGIGRPPLIVQPAQCNKATAG